jgi:DNA-binding LacI/PurR family transcriptional regulator
MAAKGTKRKDTPKGGPVTLQTIADILGVSRTTVSNAFSKPDQMTPELRARILKTADQLGYCGPDPAARILRKGKSGAYGILLTESLSYAVTDPAAVILLQGIAEVFDERDAGLLVLPSRGDRTTGLEAVRNAVVDGFLIYSIAEDDPRLAAVLARNVPTVVIEEPNLPNIARVSLEDRAGARAIAEHVTALGHRNLGAITFPLAEDDWTGFVGPDRMAQSTIRVSRDRLVGFADAAGAAGIDWADAPVYECVVNSVEEGRLAAGKLLDQPVRPTAILTTADQLAFGAILAVRERGLRVPQDVSIAGFDDIPEAARSDPPLTTVRQPLREKGTIAARLLLDGWEGPPPTEILPTELIVRDSTGPAPAQ